MADQREQETLRRVIELLALESDLEAAVGLQRASHARIPGGRRCG